MRSRLSFTMKSWEFLQILPVLLSLLPLSSPHVQFAAACPFFPFSNDHRPSTKFWRPVEVSQWARAKSNINFPPFSSHPRTTHSCLYFLYWTLSGILFELLVDRWMFVYSTKRVFEMIYNVNFDEECATTPEPSYISSVRLITYWEWTRRFYVHPLDFYPDKCEWKENWACRKFVAFISSLAVSILKPSLSFILNFQLIRKV